MAMSATTKANIGAGRQAGLRLNSKGLGTSPFSQAKSAASKSVRKVNSEVKSKIAKAKKKGIAGKPKLGSQSIKHGTHDNFDPTPSPDSFRISKAKAILENTMRAKTRLARRVTNYNNNDSLIEFAEKDSEWRKNLSLSLKRYWARKRPGRIEGNIGELQEAKKRYDSGESATSILLDPNLSGKTKTEIVGKKVGELRGKFDVIVDHIKDRGKDFKRGFKGSRRDVMGRNIAEKYNLDVVVPAVGAVGLGANTVLALKGTGLKSLGVAGDVEGLGRAIAKGAGPTKKFPIGTRLAALGALGLGAYSIATQVQRHRKPQVFKYHKDYSTLALCNIGTIEFAEADVKSYVRNGKRVKGHKRTLKQERRRELINAAGLGGGLGLGASYGQAKLRNFVRTGQKKSGYTYEDVLHNKDRLEGYRQNIRNLQMMQRQQQLKDNPILRNMDKGLTGLIDSYDELERLEKVYEPRNAVDRRLKDLYTSIDRRKDISPEEKTRVKNNLLRKYEKPGKIVKYDPKAAQSAANSAKSYKKLKKAWNKKLEVYFPKELTKGRLAKQLAIGALSTGALTVGSTFLKHKLQDLQQRKNVS